LGIAWRDTRCRDERAVTTPVRRRNVLGGTLAVPAAVVWPVAAESGGTGDRSHHEMLSAREFGAVGDGITDDTAALQKALDAAFGAGRPGFLVLPPGEYRVTRTLRITPEAGARGNIGRHSGILAHGARINSAISDGSNVIEVVSRSTIRFVLIEGLDILGSGHDGAGISIEASRNDVYFHNFCLRDIVVQECGGDGCRMIGNVFEGQLANCYFRKNGGNGATFGHGPNNSILSSIHVFGSVFGDNGRHGAQLVNGCYDVSFHGCYLLLNGKFGLVAENGCTLLSNCGFENNHQAAAGFDPGNSGIVLSGFGSLVGCTAYSVFNQAMLLRAHVVGRLVMIGCTGAGDGRAKAATLARIGGGAGASTIAIGCSGAVEYADGIDGVELGGAGGGVRLASRWQSQNLLHLGDHSLWIDRSGRLRIKHGNPTADEDGSPVGA
jgi:hypothetical protein